MFYFVSSREGPTWRWLADPVLSDSTPSSSLNARKALSSVALEQYNPYVGKTKSTFVLVISDDEPLRHSRKMCINLRLFWYEFIVDVM